MPKPIRHDSDIRKGASEEDSARGARAGDHNLRDQLGHRDQDEMLKDSDSDFPEPGSNSEHSGQESRSAQNTKKPGLR
jgi:hypothetical protein